MPTSQASLIENRRPSLPANVLFAIALGLVATATWSAWDYGGGYRSTQAIVAGLLLGIGAVAFIAMIVRRIGFSKPPVLTVLALIVWGVAFCQSVSVPRGLAHWISPGTAGVYEDWVPTAILDEAANAEDPQLVSLAEERRLGNPVSLAPTFTRMAMAGPATFAAACWLASLCFANRRVGFWIIALTAVAGTLFAFFGLADIIRLSRDWDVELRQRLVISPVGANDPFGPFVNSNNGAGYLNLTLGCAIGLLVHWTCRTGNPRANSNNPTERSSVGRQRRVLLIGCLLIVVVVMVAGILGSNSRGGFLGLLAGSLAVAVTVGSRAPKLRLIGMLVGVVVLSLLMIDGLGIRERSGERLHTLVEGETLQDPRLTHWRDAITAAIEFFPSGSGLGTYRYAYLPFQETGGPKWFVNADGMPVEWLVEGGVWLLPLIVIGMVVMVRDVRRIASNTKPQNSETQKFESLAPGEAMDSESDADVSTRRAMVIAATFILPALVVTQLFDYGILLPPLLLTVAFIAGGLSRLANDLKEPQKVQPEQGRRMKLGSLVTASVLVLALLMAVIDLSQGWIVQREQTQWWRNRRKSLVNLPSNESESNRMQNLVRWRPNNALAHRALSRLLIDEQRRLGAEYVSESQTADKKRIASLVAPITVRRAFYQNQSEPPMTIEDLMLPPQDLSKWRQARREAVAALLQCPLDDRTRFTLIELDMVHPNANRATAELLEQTAILRRRNDQALAYLQRLAQDSPGGESLQLIRDHRHQLRQQAEANAASGAK